MNSLERDRLLAVLLVGGLGVLLVLSVMNLGGSMPEVPTAPARPIAARLVIPAGSINALFAPGVIGQLAPPARTLNPFYTTHYQPPTPKAPTTRKVALLYQGFVTTAAGERRAFVKVDDKLLVGPAGSKVVADLGVKEITTRTLILTNATSVTNVLEFNTRKELEVPVP